VNASSCTLLSTPAIWAGADPATVNCNGFYAATVQAASAAQQWTLPFTATSASGQSAVSTQTLAELAPPFALNASWSGYVLPSSSAAFTDAAGSWAVPTLNCADTPDGGESAWVGLGGYRWPSGGTSGGLLQTGISDQCVNGAQEDTGWFEAVPSAPDHSEVFAGFAVSPGDAITASVFQSGSGVWETKLDDLTTGLAGFSVTGEGWGVAPDAAAMFHAQGTLNGAYAGGYSAEWIVEDFTVAATSTLTPLANYGTVSFSNLGTSLTPWALASADALAIAQNGVTLSTPSAPSSSGGFSVSYTGQ
jgi:hypothetical protein